MTFESTVKIQGQDSFLLSSRDVELALTRTGGMLGPVTFFPRDDQPIQPYAEKILVIQENQHTPMHHHILKSEDIICKSGGNLLIRLFNRGPDGKLADSDVEVSLDGVRHRVKAGHTFRLQPGDSITLTPYLYHEFWAEEGAGTAIVGEVSSVNDDETDNAFYAKVGRFPTIEEDEPVTHKLCTEY